jgi:uncharacterized protein YkwD
MKQSKTLSRTNTKKISRSALQPKANSLSYKKIYFPYIVTLVVLVLGFFTAAMYGNKVSQGSSKKVVLSYATSISSSDLLNATNAERSAAGASSLSLNSKLTNAAQAKANDMVARNYWSHNTPDGLAPWVFISNAGYSYSRAAENLANGFSNSSSVIRGWMDSTAHRTAMLNTEYSEVGFGYANSASFTDQGESTVVVAMYAKPYTTPTPTPPAAPTPTPAPPTPPAQQVTPTPAPSAAIPTKNASQQPTPQTTNTEPQVPEPTPAPTEPTIPVKESPPTLSPVDLPYATDTTSQVPSKTIKKLNTIFRQYATQVGITLLIVTVAVGVFWLYKHSKAFHRAFIKGERYVLTHIYIDALFLVLILVGIYLLQNVGKVL